MSINSNFTPVTTTPESQHRAYGFTQLFRRAATEHCTRIAQRELQQVALVHQIPAESQERCIKAEIDFLIAMTDAP